MMIVIDLGGECEDIIVGSNVAMVETLQAEKDRIQKQRDDYFEWIRHNEQVVPQIIPVTD